MERSKLPMNEASTTAVAAAVSDAEQKQGRRLTFREEDDIVSYVDKDGSSSNEDEKKTRRGSNSKNSKRKSQQESDEGDDDDLAPPEGAAPTTRRKARSVPHFGDDNFMLENVSKSIATRLLVIEEDAVTYNEIWQSCCFHSSQEWLHLAGGILALLVCLYFFMFGLQLMGSASKVMAGCASGELFGSDTNPLSSLMVGILTTVLLQSSSAVVAVVVALEEAGAMSVRAGIFTIMGANIGTTITSALVTLGQMRDVGELERGVAAASVHSLFNFMTVAVLFPVELCFGYLEALAKVLVKTAETGGKEDAYVGPIKRIVQPLVDVIIVSNSKLITGVAKGQLSCDDFYPVECDPDLDPSYASCKVGLIGCSKETGRCPIFFREDATIEQDKLSGGFTFLLALGIIVLSTMGLIVTIKFILNGLSVRIVHAVTRCNGYVGILLGGALTVFAQSSQIVVSTLVPFAGVGALPLETVYPMVVGSNVGTALQTVMTSLSAFGEAPLQVSLAHLFFNVTGMLLWYPLPQLRALPLWGASQLGHGARVWRLFPILSIVVLYLVVPFLVFGLSELYLVDSGWAKAFVLLVAMASVVGLAGTVYWCKYHGGYAKCMDFVSKLGRKRPDSVGTEATNSDVSTTGPAQSSRRLGAARAAVTTQTGRTVHSSMREYPHSGRDDELSDDSSSDDSDDNDDSNAQGGGSELTL